MKAFIIANASWLIGGGCLVLAFLIYHLLISSLKRWFHGLELVDRQINLIIKRVRTPLLTVLPLLFIRLAYPAFPLPEAVSVPINSILNIALISACAFLFIRIVNTIEEIVSFQFNIEIEDNLKARKIHTQIRVIKRVLITLILIIALASVLMTFREVRQLGTSILASAGIAGIIIGFAAQKSIGNLFAGIQLAITQPIRIDDVVIVEGEWGKIEEIMLTYAVVNIWDQRRLIVPISYFLEKPFQNWTRTTSDLLGTAYLYADYTVSIDPVRRELKRLVRDNPLWDQRVAKLQITTITEKTVELRALVSARNAGDTFQLRCDIREGLLAFLQKNFPASLPRQRVELENEKRPAIKNLNSRNP